MCKRHRITIFATAQQQASIYAYLTTSHLFCEIAQVNPPTKIERREVKYLDYLFYYNDDYRYLNVTNYFTRSLKQ